MLFKYSLYLSLALIAILFFQGSSFLGPGIFFFLLQAGFIYGTDLIINRIFKGGKAAALAEVIKQFKIFAALVFPIWILILVTDLMDTAPGRIFVIGAVVIFIILGLIMLAHVFVERSLLAEYSDRRDKEDDQ